MFSPEDAIFSANINVKNHKGEKLPAEVSKFSTPITLLGRQMETNDEFIKKTKIKEKGSPSKKSRKTNVKKEPASVSKVPYYLRRDQKLLNKDPPLKKDEKPKIEKSE